MSISYIRLWQLISPSLPVGAFSYSQGLEQAVEAGVVYDDSSALDWIRGVMENGIAHCDLPTFKRIHAAWSNEQPDVALVWNDRLLAMRETSELRLEDRTMGGAMLRLMRGLGLDAPDHALAFAGAFAIAAAQCGIPEREAITGYAWSWSEQQVSAAVKLIPLGHSAGQKMLWTLGEGLGDIVDTATDIEDDAIGMSLPGFAIRSALHETQYTRLFRS